MKFIIMFRYNDQDISDFELRRSMTASFNDILKEEKRR